MDIRAIKHAAKLSEWSERIRACRSSGKQIKTWCEDNEISVILWVPLARCALLSAYLSSMSPPYLLILL